VGGHRGLQQQCSPRLGHLAFDGKLPRVKIGCSRLCVTAAAIKAQGRKNELGTNASINNKTTQAAEITGAAPTARESKRLTVGRGTQGPTGYRGQVEREGGRVRVVWSVWSVTLTRGERQPKQPASETAEW